MLPIRRGTSFVWQEGFENFNDYQALIEQEDDVCEGVMAAVFKHSVPGTRTGRSGARSSEVDLRNAPSAGC